MIRTKGLNIGYHSPLLKIEDLTLENGDLFFLIGRNGSGKSTFLKTILGQISPISGSVFLDDKIIDSMPISELPKHISFVSAHFPNVDFLRVEEFIALGRSPYSNYFGKLSEKDMQIIDNSLEVLKISYLKGRFTSELSDGEKQMVAIAKSIAQETSIILLDEPTAFLDYANKQLVISALSKVSTEMNKCIILSTHDIDLSIENKGNYLIVDNVKKTLTNHSNLSKDEILAIAFQ